VWLNYSAIYSEWCKTINRWTDKKSLTTAINIVKQGSSINHLSLLRAFKQPLKMLVMLNQYVHFLMS